MLQVVEFTCGVGMAGHSSHCDRLPADCTTSEAVLRTIDVALQGGCSHSAFTWGVLDRLLEELSLPSSFLQLTDEND